MLSYSDELETGILRAAFWFRPVVGKEADEATVEGEVAWYEAERSAEPLLQTSLHYEVTTRRLVGCVDTRGFKPRLDLRARIAYRENGEEAHAWVRVDAVPDPWRPRITAEELATLAPGIMIEEAQTPSELRDLIDLCAEELSTLCRRRGFPPGAVSDKSLLDAALRMRVLAAYFARTTHDLNNSKLLATKLWQKRAECAQLALFSSPRFDTRVPLAASVARDCQAMRLVP